MDFEDGEIYWTSRDDDGARHDRVVIQKPGRRSRVVPLEALTQIDRWGTLGEFARAVREGREPECSATDNLGTLALVMAAVESAKRRLPIDISSAQVPTQLAI
jgi:predicted dehydrogenase